MGEDGRVAIDFDQAAICLEKNKEIMDVMQQKLYNGLPKFEESFMQ